MVQGWEFGVLHQQHSKNKLWQCIHTGLTGFYLKLCCGNKILILLLTKQNQWFPSHVACPWSGWWLVAMSNGLVIIIQTQADRCQSRELPVVVVAMVNFTYNLLERKVPRICVNTILCVSMRKFPEEINIRIGRLKKAFYNVGKRHHQSIEDL